MSMSSLCSLDAVKVSVVSDVVCPFCYIGLRNLQRASESSGVPLEIVWEPFLLDSAGEIPEGEPLIKVLSKKYSPEAAKMLLDPNSSLAQAGRAVGIVFKADRNSYPTMKAHVLVEYVKSTAGNDVANQLMEQLFERYFVRGDNISSDIVLQEILASLDVEVDDVSSITSDVNRVADVHRKDNNFKAETKVSGVPYFIIQSMSNDHNKMEPISFSGVRSVDFITHALEQISENSMIVETKFFDIRPSPTVVEVAEQI